MQKSFNPFTDEFNIGGKNLIEASAGTGKTYSIAAIYLRMILESGRDENGKTMGPGNILVVTYTKEATEELNERVRLVLRTSYRYLDRIRNISEGGNDVPVVNIDESLKNYLDGFTGKDVKDNGGNGGVNNLNEALSRLNYALLFFDEAAIFTIHKFCGKVLAENPIDTGNAFKQNHLAGDEELLNKAVYEFYRKWLYAQSIPVISFFIKGYYSPSGIFGEKNRKLENLLDRYFTSINPGIDPVSGCKTSLAEIEGRHRKLLELYREIKNSVEINAKTPAYLKGFLSQEHLLLGDIASFNIKGNKTGGKILKDDPYKKFIGEYDKLAAEIDLYIKKSIFQRLEDMAGHYIFLEKKENALTYNRMIRSVYEAVVGGGIDSGKYKDLKVLLIDEFQDTDFLQVKIFNEIFKGKTIFYIGDPKQSIYSFRGADLDAYFFATGKEECNGENKFKKFNLSTSYRSTANLIDRFNQIFSRDGFFSNKDIEYKKVMVAPSRKLRVFFGSEGGLAKGEAEDDFVFYWDRECRAKGKMAGPLIKEIKRLLSEGFIEKEGKTDKVKPSDIAVLVPFRSDAELVRNMLARNGLKSIFNSTDTVFKTDEAREIYMFFDALENYSDSSKIKSVLVLNIFNKSIKELDDDEIVKYRIKFGSYKKRLEDKGIISLFTGIFKEEKTKEKMLGKVNGERIYTNYIHLMELLQGAYIEGNLTLEGIKKWLEKRITGEEKDASGFELRLESDMEAVNISTIHGSKGLEYPIVFLIYFDYKFNKKKIDMFSCDFDHKAQRHNLKVINQGEGLENVIEGLKETGRAEYARLFYVALTRAMGRCYVMDYGEKKSDKESHKYINDFMGEEYERYLSAGDTSVRSSGNIGEKKGRGSAAPREDNFGPAGFQDGEAAADIVSGGLVYTGFDKKNIKRKYIFTSYSSLINNRFKGKSGETDEYPGEEADGFYNCSLDAVPLPETVGYLPPSGADYGNMIHALLAAIPYGITDEMLKGSVSRYLNDYNFDDNALDYTFNMVRNVINRPIIPGNTGADFSLKDLSFENRVNELEFLITVKKPAAFFGCLGEIFQNRGDLQFSDSLKSLKNEFYRIKSFFKGFIDMVFMHEGKFHLVDWKTNLLGRHVSDYYGASLLNAVSGEYYYLQLVIYQLALYRRLKLSGAGVSAVNMGNAYYIFTRGFTFDDAGKAPAGSAGTPGVFEYSLSLKELEELDGC